MIAEPFFLQGVTKKLTQYQNQQRSFKCSNLLYFSELVIGRMKRKYYGQYHKIKRLARKIKLIVDLHYLARSFQSDMNEANN